MASPWLRDSFAFLGSKVTSAILGELTKQDYMDNPVRGCAGIPNALKKKVNATKCANEWDI